MKNRVIQLCLLLLALGICPPTPVFGDIYQPVGKSIYVCSQTRVSEANPTGNITLRHKKRGKFINGKRSWSYATAKKAIRTFTGSQDIRARTYVKQMRALMKVLLTCYDVRSLPRPGATPGPTSSPSPTPGTVTFETIRPILQSNCMGCHTSRGWVLSQEYFLDNGLVNPGNPGLSTLYRNLRGNPEGYTPASMPPSGSALSLADIDVIRTWVISLAPPPNGGGGGTPGPTPPPGHFGCIQNAYVATSKMKRLSKVHLYNSILDLTTVGTITSETARSFLGDYTWAEWRGIANDFSPLGHARLDDRLDESYLEAVLVTLEGVFSRINLVNFVQGYVPTCNSSNYLTETCRNQFLRVFGRRALKSTLSTVDYDFYRRPNSNGQSQATYRDIFLTVLSAPRFLYHLESLGTPIDSSGVVLRISPTEFVTRLAYTVWGTIPDAQLLNYAEDGTVDNNPALVVSYVLDQQTAKARNGIRDFFDGWLKVHEDMDAYGRYLEVDGANQAMLQVNYGGSDLPLLTNYSNSSTISNGLRSYKEGAVNEILNLGAILTIDTGGNVAELFRTRLAPASDDMLRRNYNLAAAWDGTISNVPIAPATRAGILTRSGFLLSRGARTRPIVRGNRIRSNLLCDTTGLPNNNANPPGAETNTIAYITGTTQNRIREITEQANTQCSSCHTKYINPLGFLLERFDSNGRRRNSGQEVVFESLPGQSTIQEYRNSFDITMAPHVNRQDTTTVTGVEGLSERIATSVEMHACYTRNVVRFALNRVESDGFDGCLMNEILSDAQTVSMKEVLRRLFTSPTYRLRRRNEVYVP